MAGDWIPIDTTLPDKPEVARVAKALGKSRDEIVGMLVRFWIWAQAHTADGRLPGMTTEMLAEVVHVPHRLFGELQKVGWLLEAEGGLVIPNFERWLSQGAKRRLREREKKRWQRSKAVSNLSRFCPQFVPITSGQKRDYSIEEIEEREENLKPPAIAGGSSEAKIASKPPPSPKQVDGTPLLLGENAPPMEAKPPPEGPTPPDPAKPASPAPNTPEERPLMVFPCVGAEKSWALLPYLVAEWQEAYPNLDVLAECKRALVWIQASPKRRKTARGMPRFLVAWLNRAVDGRVVKEIRDDPTRVRTPGRYNAQVQVVRVGPEVPPAAHGTPVSGADSRPANS